MSDTVPALVPPAPLLTPPASIPPLPSVTVTAIPPLVAPPVPVPLPAPAPVTAPPPLADTALTALEGARAAALAAQAAQAAAEAHIATLKAANRRQTLLAALPGLREPAKFLALADPLLVLDADHQVTAESRTALEKFKTDYSYLFETTPGPGLGTSPMGVALPVAPTRWSEEDLAQFRAARVTPGKARGTETFKRDGWMFGYDAKADGR